MILIFIPGNSDRSEMTVPYIKTKIPPSVRSEDENFPPVLPLLFTYTSRYKPLQVHPDADRHNLYPVQYPTAVTGSPVVTLVNTP